MDIGNYSPNSLPFISKPMSLRSSEGKITIYPPTEGKGVKRVTYESEEGKGGFIDYVVGMSSINMKLAKNGIPESEKDALQGKFLKYASKKHSDLTSNKDAREILFHGVTDNKKNTVGLVFMNDIGNPEKVLISSSDKDLEFNKEEV